MTREKALEAMDKLVAMGYGVTLYERDLQSYVTFGADGDLTSIARHITIDTVSLDQVDVKALVKVADELGLEVGWSRIVPDSFSLVDPETSRQAVAGDARRHPR